MLKEKLCLCPYEVISDQQEFSLMSQTQYDVERLKKENEESTKEPMKINSPKEDESTTDWFDKNKFKKILAIVDSNKFNHKNKIGEFKCFDIKDLVNNINKNTISKILARKNVNTLSEIKNAAIKK